MELRQLAYFVAVAEEAHFTRAARRVSVAQPAISQQIRRLERELGEALLSRDRRAVSLTRAGQAFLPRARDALAAAEDARNAVAELNGLITGSLVIGTVQNLPDRRLPHVVGMFHRQHPHIDVTLLEDKTDTLIDALLSSRLDAALIGQGPYREVPGDLQSLLIAREPVTVAVYPGHRLAKRSAVGLRALRNEPLVTLTKGTGLRQTLEAACAHVGFKPRVVAETSDLRFLVDLVADEIGVAVVPESALGPGTTLARIELRDPCVERRLMLLWRAASLSPAGRAFIGLCREQLQSPDAGVHRSNKVAGSD
jgi:DNA-binding transcriptional LysR family regulator